MGREKIPKVIHYCWFGQKPLPLAAKKCIQSWEKYCSDFEIIEWNEKNFNLNSNRYVREAYENKKWAFVTDFVRLKVLYEYGGIYMDTDVEVVKPLDGFLELNGFSGFEWYDRIPTGIIGSTKKNKWIECLLNEYESKKFIKDDGSIDLTTNVKIITDKTKEMYSIKLNNQEQSFEYVTFYPFDWFCAKDLSDGKIKSTQNTHTIHHFSGSWITPKKKIIRKIINIFGIQNINRAVQLKHKLTNKGK
jgi:mannosyltransferase OCH1-like enzyme